MEIKPLDFQGDALDALRSFPMGARREAGHQLDKVQRGLEPDDWKPMPSIGSSVSEIRIWDDAGTSASSMSPSLSKLSMCCTVFRRKHKRPVRRILNSPRNVIRL